MLHCLYFARSDTEVYNKAERVGKGSGLWLRFRVYINVYIIECNPQHISIVAQDSWI